MQRILRPERFSANPNEVNANQEWKHWIRTFENFIRLSKVEEKEKLTVLINYLSPSVYDYISDCEEYSNAITILKKLYLKPVNEIFARHKLKIRRQEPGENIDTYVESLKCLSRDCNFKAVSADLNRSEYIRDAFIDGLLASHIRQRLLENYTLTLDEAVSQARALELAQHQSMQYQSGSVNSITPNSKDDKDSDKHESRSFSPEEVVVSAVNQQCFFCGYRKHSRVVCPAKEATCRSCGIKGHYQKVCRKNKFKSFNTNAAVHQSNCVASIPSCLTKAVISVSLNGKKAYALIDTGSSLSFINQDSALRLNIPVVPNACKEEVSMASTTMRSTIKSHCKVDLTLPNCAYKGVTLSVLPNLCSDVIVGHDILKRHSSLQVQFGGSEAPLNICSVAVANVEPVELFANLSPDCKPISTKSRRYSVFDYKFIEGEVQSLLKEGIIEESKSPWRAQVHVVSSENHKRRMVVDYSQTINRFTELDAFPLPRIDDIVNKVASYKVYSSIDLKSAYHQIPIKESEKQFTAFEACGKLYQFTRVPFGVRNGVPAFQRTITNIITSENLEGVQVYLDDITVCGRDQSEHDMNLDNFMKAVVKYNLTLNEGKCSFSKTTIHLLGFVISHKSIRPDPERLQPLRDLPAPKDASSLRRAIGMFSHYSQFIPKFSEKISRLNKSSFPLPNEAKELFDQLKLDVMNAVVSSIDSEGTLTVETDASDLAIGATLTLDGRPVAFFSRTLSNSEQRHSSIEKEAYAILEALRKWRHYLLGRHFRLITDQRSVAFMFSDRHSSKIKNDKIMRWKIELSCYKYEIVYRSGKENQAADSLSRICSSVEGNLTKLTSLHDTLCHPGVSRMYHWTRSKNLPYSLEEIRRITSSCRVCSEVKPRFYKHEGQLIKATQPFERLNIDFKGPLPSCTRNRYLLIIVDEFSRFPFAYPTQDMTASTVISKLKELFWIFGTPAYVHTDRGTSFMSQELKSFLCSLGVATSRTTAYNPQGNGQAERYVGIVWKAIELAVRSKNLPINKWENVFNEALHSIRSLLCTSTNATPHERLFLFSRRSSNGNTTPSWLLTPGPVLMKRPVRQSKYEPVVEEVHLIEGNPEYSHVRFPDGRETTVSSRHLAPVGEIQDPQSSENPYSILEPNQSINEGISQSHNEELNPPINESNQCTSQEPQEAYHGVSDDACDTLRRSQRERRSPTYFKDYVFPRKGRM